MTDAQFCLAIKRCAQYLIRAVLPFPEFLPGLEKMAWLLLVDSNRYSRFDRAKSKEGVEDALIDQIELRLERIEEFMKTAGDDLTCVRVSQVGAQLTEALLGGIAIHSNRLTLITNRSELVNEFNRARLGFLPKNE